MKQYCRYCANMVVGDENYCEIRKMCFSDGYLKIANHCRDFAFCETDALQQNPNTYRPRAQKEKTADNCEQIAFSL